MINTSVDQVLTAKKILRGDIKQLQIVPSVAIKLLKLTNDDNALIEDLARVIETEPILAARVLSSVNSPVYALPNTITSVHRAVNFLGFAAVRQLAVNLLFFQNLISHKTSQHFNMLLFWQHCLFVAALSRQIAIALKHPDPDLVYTAGLLHDIGKIVLESYGCLTYSDYIYALKDKPAQNQESQEQHERNFFGLSHAEIGQIFCREWDLPDVISAVVTCHHLQPEAESAYANFKTEIDIVTCADYIAWIQGITATEANYPAVFPSHSMQNINLNSLDLDQLLHQVDRELDSTREFYGIEFPCLSKLRSNLVMNFIHLSQPNRTPPLNSIAQKSDLSVHLTLPHKSLDPNEFVPWTLEAIQNHFDFDRVIMLSLDPKQRCLLASHWHPIHSVFKPFEININQVSGQLLKCLREKCPVLINQETVADQLILQHLKVDEFIAMPITHQNRLISVFYADNSISGKALSSDYFSEIIPIANELGIALTHARQYEIEKKRAQIDPLTKLFNKRVIDQYLSQLFQDDMVKQHLAIGFVDIDRFKHLNDTCGHQAGDDALKIVADILRNLTRPRDFISRYGGEEFLFVLKNTNKTGALGYAERIRAEIERRGKLLQYRFNDISMTASIGVSLFSTDINQYTDMIEIADLAMYKAKQEGRNKVVLMSEPISTNSTSNKFSRKFLV